MEIKRFEHTIIAFRIVKYKGNIVEEISQTII